MLVHGVANDEEACRARVRDQKGNSQRNVIEANFLEAMRNGTAGRDVLKRLADERAAKKPAPAKSN